ISHKKQKGPGSFDEPPGPWVLRWCSARSRCDRRLAGGWTIGAGARGEPATTTAATHAGRLTDQDSLVLLLSCRARQVFPDYTEKMRLLSAATLALALLTAAPEAPHRLPATVTPDHYDLAFVVDLGRERFDGTETIKVNVAEPTSRVVLNAVDIEFRQVTIGAGAAAQTAAFSLDEASQTATLTVPKPLPRGPA